MALKDKAMEERKQVRQFGITGLIFFGLLALFAHNRGKETVFIVFSSICVLFLILNILPFVVLRKFFSGWMKVVGGIGWVNRQILLSIVYYLVFTPAAVIFRIIGKDPMSRRYDPSAGSYWIMKKEEAIDPSRYEQRF